MSSNRFRDAWIIDIFGKTEKKIGKADGFWKWDDIWTIVFVWSINCIVFVSQTRLEFLTTLPVFYQVEYLERGKQTIISSPSILQSQIILFHDAC